MSRSILHTCLGSPFSDHLAVRPLGSISKVTARIEQSNFDGKEVVLTPDVGEARPDVKFEIPGVGNVSLL